MPEATAAVGATLTDGSGVGTLTRQKLIKDFVVDFLMSVPVSLGTITLFDLQSEAARLTAVLGVGNALIGAAVRVALKWATSP